MSRPARFAAVAAALACLALLALSLYLRSWGGLALIALAAAGIGWYRHQVAHSDEGQDFFGDMGEETRLTAFQAGTASELPGERAAADAAQQPPAERSRG